MIYMRNLLILSIVTMCLVACEPHDRDVNITDSLLPVDTALVIKEHN